MTAGKVISSPTRFSGRLTDHENSVRDLATYTPGSPGTTTVVNHLVFDSYGNITSGTRRLPLRLHRPAVRLCHRPAEQPEPLV